MFKVISGLWKTSSSFLKAYLGLKRKITQQKLLSKKEADKLITEAFENTHMKNIEKYSDADQLGSLALKVNALLWIRKHAKQGYEVNQFCDKEIQLIKDQIDDRDILHKISAFDYEMIQEYLESYDSLLIELSDLYLYDELMKKGSKTSVKNIH